MITGKQEQALRLCHHDFEGLTQKEAAKKMNISHQAISELLAHVKKAIPDCFPILTKLEAQVYHYYMVEGWEVDEIAEYMEKSRETIYKTLHRTRDKGMYFTEAKGRVLSYDPSMDVDVRQKF